MIIYFFIKQIYNLISFIDLDIDSNNNGFYQLNAVLTYKSRSSSSGHYVASVRRNQSKSILRFFSLRNIFF